MCEQLLGYLLGALDPDEQQEIDARLQNEPELQSELERLRRCLTPLEVADVPPEPPGGLAARTCRFIFERAEFLEWQVRAATSSWRPVDFAVAASICVAACMLIFPAIANSQLQARIVGCQENLRSLGVSLMQFSNLHNGDFPRVPTEGALAVAGSYAPQLQEAGLLESERRLFCPGAQDDEAREALTKVPTMAEVEAASAAEVARLRRIIGGSYGYTLGYMEGGKYRHVRNRSRERFALMADAPREVLSPVSLNHGASGQNVLFEDMHVEFLPGRRLPISEDDIYLNDWGMPGAGRHENDSSIGASATSPFIFLEVAAPTE